MSELRTAQIKNLNGAIILDGSSGTANLAPTIIAAGTTSIPQLQFKGGELLTIPQDGTIEFSSDNKSFYVTSDLQSGQGALDESYIFTLNADRTLVGTVVIDTFYSIFGVGLSVNPGLYFFDTNVGLRTGATSHTVAFKFGGTSTISSVQYRTEFTNLVLSTGTGAPGTPLAPVSLMFVGNPSSRANGVISPASTTVSKFFRVTGFLEVTAAGTLDPEISFSANPTGTNQATKLSYIRISPFGSTLPVTFGSWA